MTKNSLKIVKSTKNQEAETKEKGKALEAAISQIDENFGKYAGRSITHSFLSQRKQPRFPAYKSDIVRKKNQAKYF